MVTAEEILKEKDRDIVTVPKEALLKEAILTMQKEKIGSILIEDEGQIVGIFTERDLLNNITKSACNLDTAKISDFMNTDLLCAPYDSTLPQLQDILLGKYLRHIIIKKDERYIGLISAGDVTRANLVESEKTLHSVSLDYYEDWKWKKGRKK